MRVLVYGAGRMAQAIAGVLAGDPSVETLLVSPDPDGTAPRAAVAHRTGASVADMGRLLQGTDAVIMAGEVWAGTADIARMARRWGCHYLDVTENPASSAAIATIAEGAAQGFAPGCGLAPGYVTALVADHLRDLGPLGRITAHVGVLPARRTNRLGYGNLWGVDGLLVEYTNPCRAIRDGRATDLPPLTEAETVQLGSETFESFTTAGSLDDLVARAEGQIGALVFKTLRYPGHLDYIRLLMEDLGLARNRHLLRSLLMNGLPLIEDDRVLIALDIQRGPGQPVRRLEQQIRATQDSTGHWHSAGLGATAAHVCAMTDLLCRGQLDRAGHIAPGSVPLSLLRRSPYFAPLHAETMLPTMEA